MSDFSSECDESNVSAIVTSVPQTVEPNYQAKTNYPARGKRGGYSTRIFRRTRGGGYRQSTGQHDYDNNKVIHIPSTKVGRVIGRGGLIIRNLQYQTETKIIIGCTEGDKTSITLLGSDSAISQVEEIIKDLTTEPSPNVEENHSNE
ncbi:unnamed protein product [Pieris macdunnoughi]|uniref:K Homology domain-containing protein n=1 Tax=Pieris macdunnoughi TaxID=345717 RepID=A0A821L5J2_9NEOP|nr:unnamed protein product [Pieris macdunnoughi]